jgi:hypothetical protein
MTRRAQMTAMSSVEIGDARVDTGAVSEQDRLQPPFDPTVQLSWQQVVHVMDRLLDCEVRLRFFQTRPERWLR